CGGPRLRRIPVAVQRALGPRPEGVCAVRAARPDGRPDARRSGAEDPEVAAAALDMQWHTLAPGTKVPDADAFELEALKKARVDVPEVPPRYRSSYFLHIWGNGY